MRQGRFARSRFIVYVAIMCSMLFGAEMFLYGCKKPQNDDTVPDAPYDENSGINLDNQLGNLVFEGKAYYKIVVPNEAQPAEVTASTELQSFILRSTGVTLDIVLDTDSGVALGQRLISVGNTKLFKESSIDVSNLNIDGFKIKTVGNTIIIKGQRDRGTLYGVYDFLERMLGVRYVTKDYDYVPSLSAVPVYELDITEIPAFATRSHYAGSIVKDLTFASKRRMTAPGNASGEGAIKVGGAYNEDWLLKDFHSFEELLPFSKYKTEHPDWFARTDVISQPVLSNGLNDDGTVNRTADNSMLLEMVKNIKELLLEKPDAVYVMLGQNDNRYVSEREDCVRQRELFGGHGGHVVAFVNAVAGEIDSWLKEEGMERELYFVTMAYQFSFTPPITDSGSPVNPLSVPQDNVYIMLCPYEASFNSPLDDVWNNAYFANGLRGWSSITDKFFVFDYDVNFDDYLMWYPNAEVILPNIKLYQQIGVAGVITNGYIYTGDVYQHSLHTWLFSKLMWNTNRDINALVSEFNRLYVGESASSTFDLLVSYIDVHFKDVATDGNSIKRASIWGKESTWMTDINTLNVNFIYACEGLISEAKTRVNSASISEEEKQRYLYHISTMQIQVMLMRHKNYDALFKTTEIKKIEFMQECYQSLLANSIDRLSINASSAIHLVFANYI